MRTEKFDEILDQCLSMMQAGASIDDCVARYPQHADELRAQLQTAQTLWDAKPTAQPEPVAQAKGRSRLLTAVGELQQSAPSRSALWFWPISGLRSPIRLGQALPAVVALLVLGGLAASAAVIQPDVPVLREIFGDESSSSNGDEPRMEIEDGECELRGPITSLDPLVINGVTIDASNAEELRGDLAQAMADGTEVRARGDFVDGICIASQIEVHVDDDAEADEPRTEIADGECELRGPITSLDPLVINGITIDASSAEEVRGDLPQAMADSAEVRVKGDFVDGICIASQIEVHVDDDD